MMKHLEIHNPVKKWCREIENDAGSLAHRSFYPLGRELEQLNLNTKRAGLKPAHSQ
jgi:hypothetical protein